MLIGLLFLVPESQLTTTAGDAFVEFRFPVLSVRPMVKQMPTPGVFTDPLDEERKGQHYFRALRSSVSDPINPQEFHASPSTTLRNNSTAPARSP